MQPVFILSLPRSGSTLLQRTIAAHPEVATVSEPWLALPVAYSLRRSGVIAEYHHQNLVSAIEDFSKLLPAEEDYLLEFGQAIMNLYSKVAKDERYFIDKTPRYHLIIDDLLRMFPDGKYILLWRNPLAIAASMMETWSAGRWNLHRFHIDLYDGVDNLINASRKYADIFHILKFEELVNDPKHHVSKIFEFLELEAMENESIDINHVDLQGRMGDPTGIQMHNSISSSVENKWKRSFCNPARKAWAKRYLDWIGEEGLNEMGYEQYHLETELSNIPISARLMVSDVLRMIYAPAFRFFSPFVKD